MYIHMCIYIYISISIYIYVFSHICIHIYIHIYIYIHMIHKDYKATFDNVHTSQKGTSRNMNSEKSAPRSSCPVN